MKKSRSNYSSILDLIKAERSPSRSGNCYYIEATPAVGVLYVTKASPYFLSGHVRLRGRNNGKYPYKHLEMIDSLFGPESNTIEVCSNNLGSTGRANTITVDINPDNRPDIVDDAQVLSKVESDRFNRWRADPPYNEKTAEKMYDTKLPETSKLLTAGARVIKPGSLMFLLLGPQNVQWHPPSIKRIGIVFCTIVPNQEVRALHIYYKM